MTARTSAALQQVVEIDARRLDSSCCSCEPDWINVAYISTRATVSLPAGPSSSTPMSNVPPRVESVDIVDTSLREPPGMEGGVTYNNRTGLLAVGDDHGGKR